MEYLHIYLAAFGLSAVLILFLKNTVPNMLLLGLVALFPIAWIMSGGDFADMVPHLIAGVVALVVAIALFAAASGQGGGVLKMLAVVTLWTPLGALSSTLFAALGVPVILMLIARLFSKTGPQRVANFYAVISLSAIVAVNLYNSQLVA